MYSANMHSRRAFFLYFLDWLGANSKRYDLQLHTFTIMNFRRIFAALRLRDLRGDGAEGADFFFER